MTKEMKEMSSIGKILDRFFSTEPKLSSAVPEDCSIRLAPDQVARWVEELDGDFNNQLSWPEPGSVDAYFSRKDYRCLGTWRQMGIFHAASQLLQLRRQDPSTHSGIWLVHRDPTVGRCFRIFAVS